MKYFVLFLLFNSVLFGEVSWHEEQPGGFSATVTIPKTDVTVLDTVTIDLVLEFPQGYHVDADKLTANLSRQNSLKPAPFKILSVDASSKRIQYTLQPQVSGNHVLSFYDISFLSEGKTVNLISDLFEINVKKVPLEDPSTLLIGPLLRLSPNFPITLNEKNRQTLMGPESQLAASQYNRELFQDASFPWWIVLLILAIILLTWAVKEAGKPQPKPEEIAKKAEEDAWAKLQTLESQKLPQKNQFMPFYIKLTETARDFIEKKYLLKAPTLTTQEFLNTAANYPAFDPEMRKRLEKFLLSADRVKFAQHSPSIEECYQALNDAKHLMKP